MNKNGNPSMKRAGYSRLACFLPFLVIPAVILLVYSNTFHSPFIFDDDYYIVNNGRLYQLSNFWPPSGTRYLGFLSFALNYHMGGLDVFGYHLVNVIIHIINALLVFSLVTLVLRTPRLASFGVKNPFGISLAVSLIFALHPIQTQAVTYTTQRFASLAALFYLLAIALYARWRQGKGSVNRAWYILALVSTVLAMKTKEISFTLPAAIVLFEAAFYGKGGWRKRALSLVPFLLTFLVIPISIFAAGPEEGYGAMRELLESQRLDLEKLSRTTYLFTEFRVIVTYLRLLVLPINQSLDYYNYPRFQSFFEAQVILSFLFLAAVFAFAVWLIYRSIKRGQAYTLLAGCGLIWFFMALSVESSVIPIADIIFEHRLYLPSVGAALAFTSLVFHGVTVLGKKGMNTKALGIGFFAVLLIVLGAASYKRNFVWKDNLTMYRDIASKDPMNPRAHFGMGNAYLEMNRADEAIEELLFALRLKPDLTEAMQSLSNAYLKKGLVDEAIEVLKAQASVKPTSNSYYNLGEAYVKKGLPAEAVEQYKKAIELNPDNLEAYYNLGNTYHSLKRYDEAIGSYLRLLRIKPGYCEAHFNLGNSYMNKGMTEAAVEHYEWFIRTAPPGYEGLKANVARRIEVLRAQSAP